MRSGWIGNTDLQEAMLRADRSAHVIVEAVTIDAEDVKDTRDEWTNADSTAGVTVLDDGGARITGSENVLAKSTAVTNDIITDLDDEEPFDILEVRWKRAGAEDLELHKAEVRVNNDVSSTGMQVRDYRAQLFRVSAFFGGSTGPIVLGEQVELMPISERVEVSASGTTAAAIFDFTGADRGAFPRVGPPPTGLSKPRTYLIVWALDADGLSVGNVALRGTTAATQRSTTSYEIEAKRWVKIDDSARIERGSKFEEQVSTNIGGVPFLKVFNRSYTEQTITFSSTANRPNLGSTVSLNDVEFTAVGEPFGGSSITYQLKSTTAGSTWTDFVDGDLAGEDNTSDGGKNLSAVTKTEKYDVRATLTPSTDGFVTPVVRRVGLKTKSDTNLDGVAMVEQAAWSVDPITLQGEVTEARIRLIRSGEVDYRDPGTELFSDNYVNDVEFRVFIGSTDLDRKDWLHVDSFLIDDYEAAGPDLELTCLSNLALLKNERIPARSASTGGTRSPITYSTASATLKSAYRDILAAQIGVSGRHLGPEIEDTTTVAKRVTETEGKAELDRLAYLAGGGIITSQGRIVFRDMFLGGGAVELFPDEEIKAVSITPGFRGRVPKFYVPYQWDDTKNEFAKERASQHANVLANLGRARIDVEEELDAETAKWIPSSTLAESVAHRVTENLGAGLILWRFKATYPRPHLEPGDVVAVNTDRFVARDPNVERELRGSLWGMGVVQAVHDVWGEEFTVWIQGYHNLSASIADITRREFVTPRVIDVSLSADSQLNVDAEIQGDSDAESFRVAASTGTAPSKATVQGGTLVVASSDHHGSANDIATITKGQTLWVGALAYETSAAGGRESFDLFTTKLTFDEDVPSGSVTLDDFEPTPEFRMSFNAPTATVTVNTATGGTFTSTGHGGTTGLATYEVGVTSLDGTTATESELTDGETRQGYTVTYTGNGFTRKLFDGAVHGTAVSSTESQPFFSGVAEYVSRKGGTTSGNLAVQVKGQVNINTGSLVVDYTWTESTGQTGLANFIENVSPSSTDVGVAFTLEKSTSDSSERIFAFGDKNFEVNVKPFASSDGGGSAGQIKKLILPDTTAAGGLTLFESTAGLEIHGRSVSPTGGLTASQSSAGAITLSATGVAGSGDVGSTTDETITGKWTFSRGSTEPFAVSSSNALVVPNLDADKLDGFHSTHFSAKTHTHTAGDLTNVDDTADTLGSADEGNVLLWDSNSWNPEQRVIISTAAPSTANTFFGTIWAEPTT